ncbi:MAG: hypothetical protein QW587_02840, partial [Candidatus Bathyarchaeia archaeon]
YNATYFIPPTDPNGTYRFLIQANALVDNVNETWWHDLPYEGSWTDGKPTVNNTGPAEDNYSDYFVVGPFQLLVEVWTDKPAYAKGETVLITATARYKDGSYLSGASVPNWYGWPHTVVSGAQVWVDIYWPNGTWHMKLNLLFTPPTPTLPPRWTGSYPTTVEYLAGIYVVNCTADDKKGNIGWDDTTFLLAGLILEPTSGTVPPDWAPYLSYDAATGLVSAQIYSAGAKSLGTLVTVSASANTLPVNTTFILTIEAADIPAVTAAWYSNPVNLNVTDISTKGIQLAVVTSKPDGSLDPVTFVWPSMPNGTYTLLAIKNGTATPWTKAKALASNDFTVIPGLIVAPQNGNSAYTQGNTLCEVVATGYPQDAIYPPMPHWVIYPGGEERDIQQWNVTEPIVVLLINGTDALLPHTIQSWAAWIAKAARTGKWAYYSGASYGPAIPFVPVEWRFDGTATLLQALSAETKVIPGFVMPVIQPGVYEIELLAAEVFTDLNRSDHDPNSDTWTQTITTLQSASDTVAVYGVTKDLIDLIAALDAKIVQVQGDLVTINTTLGEVQVTVDDINAKVTAVNDTVVTISTDVGTALASLSAIEAKIDSVNGTVVQLQTTLGSVETTLADLGGKVTAINGKVATIETSLGTVAADVSAVKASVTSVQGSIATISTDLGTVKGTVSSIASDVTEVKGTVSGLSTATWIAAIAAIVAAIVAIIAVIQITRKVYMPK